MRKILSTILVVIVAFMLGGCAGADIAALWQKANPVEKSIYLVETYNTQYDSYIDVIAYATGIMPEQVKWMAKNEPVKLKATIDASSLTEEARNALRFKKSILSKIDTPVEEFAKAARAGFPTSAAQEEFIIKMLNKLKYRAYTK